MQRYFSGVETETKAHRWETVVKTSDSAAEQWWADHPPYFWCSCSAELLAVATHRTAHCHMSVFLNQGCFCCCVYMASCVPGPADDHAGHRNPAANVVFLPSDRPGPPVTAHTASPHRKSSESTHTLQLCPVDEYDETSKQIRDIVLQQTHTFCFPFLYRVKRLNSQHTSLLLSTEK